MLEYRRSRRRPLHNFSSRREEKCKSNPSISADKGEYKRKAGILPYFLLSPAFIAKKYEEMTTPFGVVFFVSKLHVILCADPQGGSPDMAGIVIRNGVFSLPMDAYRLKKLSKDV